MGKAVKKQVHRLQADPARGVFSIGYDGDLRLILNDGSSISGVPPDSSVFTGREKLFIGTAGSAVAGGKKGQGSIRKETIFGSKAQFMGFRALFTAAWASCFNSLSRNNFRMGQDPERREFITANLKMCIFEAAGLADPTNLFKHGGFFNEAKQ